MAFKPIRCAKCRVRCLPEELEKDEYVGVRTNPILDDRGFAVDFEFTMRRYGIDKGRDSRRKICNLCRLENAGQSVRGTYGTQPI